MSRVGKNPISIPAGVKVAIADKRVSVEGPKGKLAFTLHDRMEIVQEGATLLVKRPSDEGKDRALHGTSRAVIANMVVGVSTGFKKELEIRGVGYRGEQKGNGIQLALGFSHPVIFTPPTGVTVKMDGNLKVLIEGSDRQAVGQVAAEIRAFRPPEPYKGKGVRYVDEVVIMKEVKKT
jgi:large subunit ribosomal protein L6